jgi:hypothetical protein
MHRRDLLRLLGAISLLRLAQASEGAMPAPDQ